MDDHKLCSGKDVIRNGIAMLKISHHITGGTEEKYVKPSELLTGFRAENGVQNVKQSDNNFIRNEFNKMLHVIRRNFDYILLDLPYRK
jgi:hypothetical protein